MFLDRVFSDNKNYEIYCILCGERRFINRNSVLGIWLEKKEKFRENTLSR